MPQFLEHTDNVRKEVGRRISRKHKSEFGQFLTPSTVAHFMASLFSPSNIKTARLLDAGAGIGSLSGAFLDRWLSGDFGFRHVETVAYEIDEELRGHLLKMLAHYQAKSGLACHVEPGDFIEEAVKSIWEGRPCFTHAILNPPYKKISRSSRHRFLLRKAGIETVNLYSAFVALAIELMKPGGQVVAITPRSFCNGPYYRPFRELILAKTALKHIHLFSSRDRAFKDDAVLQENIIILLERNATQEDVTVSTSTDDRFDDGETHVHPFHHIVFPDDPERFIRIPTSPERNRIETSPAFSHSLADIGVEVSTGPVVDFRMKTYLRPMPGHGTVPLLYPHHFHGQSINWPKPNAKKPNAIFHNEKTEKWLYPPGCYVVTRRFSSKEEKRRIVAHAVCPGIFNGHPLGFENHLNVFHCGKKGIPEDITYGLSVFLNSTAADDYFRRFSGHTQVNATDLRLMKYPSREALSHLGIWAKNMGKLTQGQIDKKIDRIAWQKTKT